jgi:hypothetical protein
VQYCKSVYSLREYFFLDLSKIRNFLMRWTELLTLERKIRLIESKSSSEIYLKFIITEINRSSVFKFKF